MDINLNFGIDTKIDAINRVLDAIGSVGVNSEEELEYNIDAASADKLIDSISEKVQVNLSRGWWFNRESFHKLSPDAVNGEISVPSNTLSCLVKRQRGKHLMLTLRGNKLFDPTEYGYDMTPLVDKSGYLPCILVVNLPFDYLPASAKHAITDAARFWFVNDKEGDQIKMNALQKAADGSYSSLQAEENRQSRRNLLNNTRVQYDMYLAGGNFNNN